MRRIASILICGLIGIPLGCAGENEAIELNLRVDNTPMEREESPVVNSYSGILREVQPAVVSVYSQRLVEEEGWMDHPALRQFFGREGMPRDRMQRGVGSGVIVSREGFILTNNHVIEGADRIIVQFANDGHMEAEVVGTDEATDIAVLRLNGGEREEFPFAVLANSDLIEVGDVVFALGNALGIGHAVTSGIVSARGRTGIGILGEGGYEDFIQTDASMNIGNSGGPLVDSWGRVIGINTAIASPGGGNVGIGFAIPINMARLVMEDLLEFGEVRRGYLGISLRDPHPGLPVEFGAPDRGPAGRADYEGALVVDVVENSPAAQAGLREGDFVVEINGRYIRSASDLRLEVAQTSPGTEVALGIIRDDEEMTVSATLGNLGDAGPRNRSPAVEGEELIPGLMAAPLTAEIRERIGVPGEIEGLVVTSVETTSPYAEVFPPGAVIVQINRQPVTGLDGARELLRAGRNLVVMYYEGAVHHVLVELDGR